MNNRVSDNPDFGVGASCGAQILLEGSFFERVAFPTLRRDCLPDNPSPGLIFAPEGSNGYEATGAHQLSGADSQEPRDPVSVPLTYAPFGDDLDEARFTVPDRAGAGSRWHQPFDLDEERGATVSAECARRLSPSCKNPLSLRIRTAGLRPTWNGAAISRPARCTSGRPQQNS